MSIETFDWDTVSLKLDNSIHNPKIKQKNLKESSLSAAIEMNDYKILQYLTRTNGGLINSEFRKLVWPILLGVGLGDDGVTAAVEDWTLLPPHKDEDQVALDVGRSFVYYPQNISTAEKNELKCKLKDIIIRILRTYPELSYYQGYHDICTLFLIIFQNDLDICFKVVSNFTLFYLRDFMMPDIDVTIKMLKLIPELTLKADKSLYKDAMMNEIEPFYCLSAIITIFAHDVLNFNTICQIFDFIIASGSISSIIYLYVSLLSQKKDKIFEKISMIDDDEADCFSKQDLIHDSLSKFMRNTDSNDINKGLQNCIEIMKKYPLEKLKNFKNINKYSVLRTNTLVPELDKEVLEDRIKSSNKILLSKQVNEAKIKPIQIPDNHGRIILLKKLLGNRRNQQLFTVSITIGIISLLLNILLNKTDTSQLIDNISRIWNNNNNHIADHVLNVGIRPFKNFFMRSF